jgi:excisionase family DNA binding protein
MSERKEISTAEAARRLGVRIDYLTMLLRSGRLTCRKQDGVWRIDAAAVEERRRSRPTAGRPRGTT